MDIKNKKNNHFNNLHILTPLKGRTQVKRLKKTQNWILIHKQDHDMCLLGQTQTGTRWKQLEWLI